MTNKDDLLSLYTNGVEYTWNRPKSDARIEGELLRRAALNLVEPGGIVADIGGGNGAYAFPLLESGVSVDLFDITPNMIKDAQRRYALDSNRYRGTSFSASVADAKNLAVESNSYDGVLFYGPYYCAKNVETRQQQLIEATRVLKPSGPILIQALTVGAAIRATLNHWPNLVSKLDWPKCRESGSVEFLSPFSGQEVPLFLRTHHWTSDSDISQELASIGLSIDWIRSIDFPDPERGQANLSAAPQAVVDDWADLVWDIGLDRSNFGGGDTLLVRATKASCSE